MVGLASFGAGFTVGAVFFGGTSTRYITVRVPALQPCVAIANIPSLDENGLYYWTPVLPKVSGH